MSDPAWRWGAGADQSVDLVAFNGDPHLPDEPVNPPRRHRTLAVVVAALAGCAAALIVALLVPATRNDLVAFVLLIGSFMGAVLLTLVAWDRWVSHRRPAWGSGMPADRVHRLADGIASPLLMIAVWLLREPIRPWSGDRWDLQAAAVLMVGVTLTVLGAWLLMLGLGRVVERNAGTRAASLVLGTVLALTFITAVVGLAQYKGDQGGSAMAAVGETAGGIELWCWGINETTPCEARAEYLLDWFRRTYPERTPTSVEVRRVGGDLVCYRHDGSRDCIEPD